jgi:hypothetical protein
MASSQAIESPHSRRDSNGTNPAPHGSHRKALESQRDGHMDTAVDRLITCEVPTWLHHYGHVYQTFGEQEVIRIQGLLPETTLGKNRWEVIKKRIADKETENVVFSEMANIVEQIRLAATQVHQSALNPTSRLEHHPNDSPHGSLESRLGRPGGQFMTIDVHATEPILYPKARRSPLNNDFPTDMNEILDIVSLEEYKVDDTPRSRKDVSQLHSSIQHVLELSF